MNWAVQHQMARGLKFRNLEVEGLNVYRAKTKALFSCAVTVTAADLRFCFPICKNQIFSPCDSYVVSTHKDKRSFVCLFRTFV